MAPASRPPSSSRKRPIGGLSWCARSTCTHSCPSPRTGDPMAKVSCSLCQTMVEARTIFSAQKMEMPLYDLIKRERPEWAGNRGICAHCHEEYHAKKLLSYLEQEYDKISEMERTVVTKIARRGRIARLVDQEYEAHMTFGEHVADKVAHFGGSWTFIMIFGAVLF